MPGGDGTGPDGTYRNCRPADGYAAPGFGRGRGRGRGRGFGRGLGRRFWNRSAQGLAQGTQYAPVTKDEEIAEIKEQLREIKEAEKDLERRMDELSKE